MIPEIAVLAKGLGKRYRLGSRSPYGTLREALTRRRIGAHREDDTFMALRGISFEIRCGEVVGVVGRNGAGKSTLLRILSRITPPSEGRAEIRGRVRSLLEVGTGFHPELTGRENIYLNGAMLGMRKREIDRQFDAIVAFAEIERHLDTPVKHYSTGMYMRLGFSVAAHLEPEILLVDEVLAVGDAAFQSKSLGLMGSVARQGRTVLLVSHQMNAIRRLCSRCLWLDKGELRMDGSASVVVSAYETAHRTQASSATRSGTDSVRFLEWAIASSGPEPLHRLETQGPVTLRITLEASRPIQKGIHGIALYDQDSQLIWAWAHYEIQLQPGRHELRYALPFLPLRPGNYTLRVTLSEDGTLLDDWHCMPELLVATEPLGHPMNEWTGILNLPCAFKVMPL